ncbi:Inorganic polyphosphate/ATP-NAD kinase [Sphingobium herbicidovorans NBRC 16415]|uniref:Inorganic polyphosphate/ATP-NAD kinase n=1 Tax=Sphingobium herbicidovorans (strain ATCC 700291 / DSM 11019 / CCUG 56400 / KCTC 2939 / LMG 18315 / NBRC 16415 / MH) TaxID=1219045 RepID=A0A086PAA9_SPHHM|nr:NAD(+)/NADH kinase [Sphingobium herbicidovorans]KFG90327.1 Inorganic polyphosphate/ATP-NAD kinase [Sphingobium herbicidovorans NBRC 16415]
MPTNSPRAVFVTRESNYELLLARHATREQARFFLETRGQRIETLEDRDCQLHDALKQARLAVPDDWRQAHVRRPDLDRFLFGPEDVIVPVGQDGLVANVAKYLASQPVLGVNPSPDLYDGILVRVPVRRLADLLRAAAAEQAPIEYRTMVEARLDTGERLLALNEVFVGHRSHQSARFSIVVSSGREDHSSSGLIVASGTGATGWARSIMESMGTHVPLTPEERAVAYFVREAFPSIATGTSIRAGKLAHEPIEVTSRMNDGGVIFADGMEQDFLVFDWGRRVFVAPAAHALHLVTG